MRKVFDKEFDKAFAEVGKSLGSEASLVEDQVVQDENQNPQHSEEVDIEKAFGESELPVTGSKLKADLIVALKALPEELNLNLTSRVNRFFNKSNEYQKEHLSSFIDGLIKTIDNYVEVPSYDENVDENHAEYARDIFANIALALVSLLIFYPLVLAITSYAKGQDYGFYRVNDGRNELYPDLVAEIKTAKQQLGVVKSDNEETESASQDSASTL